ncbi:MAG: zinc-ribbon domain-containing protein [Muribaculaceae bacterium]|nr:zinc-ribbon domain-containing protein [Muribaculaceae bacterium]
MRCKNCGWPNKPNETKCTKCGSPLSSNDDDFDIAGAVTDSGSVSPLNKTVREEDVFNQNKPYDPEPPAYGRTQVENPEHVSNMAQCPKCGYPLRPGVDKCPNCKFQISSAHRHDNPAPDRHGDPYDLNREPARRATRMASEPAQKPNFRGTINPYMMNLEIEPTFILKPMKRMEERRDFDEQEYEGKEVVLNRDNTEPNNPSITSRQQAVITNEDGRWYIEDKSDQKTTFVRAGQKIELHDGDIILLGNRLFEFRK